MITTESLILFNHPEGHEVFLFAVLEQAILYEITQQAITASCDNAEWNHNVPQDEIKMKYRWNTDEI